MTPDQTPPHHSPDPAEHAPGTEDPATEHAPAEHPHDGHPRTERHPADEPLHGAVFRLARLLARHERRPGPAGGRGLHRGQGRVLALLELRQRMSQRELAFLLGVRPQSLGELLAKLERAGLVQRATDPDDRRTMTVELTPAGAAAAEEARSTQAQIESDPWEALTGEERAELARLLDLVIRRLEDEDGRLHGPGHRPGPFPGFGPFGPDGPHDGPRPPFGPRGRGWFGAPEREAEDTVTFGERDAPRGWGRRPGGRRGGPWRPEGNGPLAAW